MPFLDKHLQPFSLLDPNREIFSTNRESFPVNREIPGITENLGSERMEWVKRGSRAAAALTGG
jgi:hypothetical protein